MKICEGCEILDSCNGRMMKIPSIIQSTIQLFLESQIDKVSYKFGTFNKQPDWFKSFWYILRENLPIVMKELRSINGDNDR